MNNKKKKGFTIAELVIALMLIAFIAMLLMPVVFSSTKSQVLMTALNKNYTALQAIHQAIPMLQARGKISPGSPDASTFMQAVALTQNAIGLRDGNVLIQNNKFAKYISGYTTTPSALLPNYTQFSLDNANLKKTTIILKNGVFISKYTDDSTDYIMVDINGKKTPNKTGEDIFFFEIVNSSGFSYSNSAFQPVDDNNCEVGAEFATSKGCAKKYIEAGKME